MTNSTNLHNINSPTIQNSSNLEITLNQTDIQNLNVNNENVNNENVNNENLTDESISYENISDENMSDENITEENSSNSENLTSSMLSINNDLNSSTLSINEEENNLLNNYQYSSDIQTNIDTTVDEFIKFTQTYPEFVDLISKTRKNIDLLPELMKSIKMYNYRLALNIMDNPGFCFEKIFDILFNKTHNIENHKDSINKLLEIFPEYSEDEIFSILKLCNYSIDSTIEYLC